MKAVILEKPGPPDSLLIREIPEPEPKSGWITIRVRALGLNRSEMFTRQGHSRDVRFPRVLGIECVGEVEAAPETPFQIGGKVLAVLGGMGRQFDGSYAEFTQVPAKHVQAIRTTLEWKNFAAIPEMFLTVWGSLTEALDIKKGETLLVRGGTSSIGMAAITYAKRKGLVVLATTRNENKAEALKKRGADHVIIDDGNIAAKIRSIFPQGVNKVLELVGTVTLVDSLAAASEKGSVCMSGILGNQWTLREFTPMAAIPSTVKLTTFQSDRLMDLSRVDFQSFIDDVETGAQEITIDRVFKLSEIVEAHRYMEENRAIGKLVVLID